LLSWYFGKPVSFPIFVALGAALIAAVLYYAGPTGIPEVDEVEGDVQGAVQQVQGVVQQVQGVVGGYSVASIQAMIVAACAQCGFPAQVALAIASEESGFNPNATNVNANGTTDWGVMQVNDSVWQTQGLSQPGTNFLDPQTNINVGVGLLCAYYTQYNGNMALVTQAYAIGPGTLASGYQLSAAQAGTLANVTAKWNSYVPPAGLLA
jgi:Transglycosylase SLT domain